MGKVTYRAILCPTCGLVYGTTAANKTFCRHCGEKHSILTSKLPEQGVLGIFNYPKDCTTFVKTMNLERARKSKEPINQWVRQSLDKTKK